NEVAVAKYPEASPASAPLTKVATPGKKSIEDITSFLKIAPTKTAKTLVYVGTTPAAKPGAVGGRKIAVVLVRGDREVNDIKLAKFLRGTENLRLANEAEIMELGGKVGYMSPNGLDLKDHDAVVLVDPFLLGEDALVSGADEADYHVTG